MEAIEEGAGVRIAPPLVRVRPPWHSEFVSADGEKIKICPDRSTAGVKRKPLMRQ